MSRRAESVEALKDTDWSQAYVDEGERPDKVGFTVELPLALAYQLLEFAKGRGVTPSEAIIGFVEDGVEMPPDLLRRLAAAAERHGVTPTVVMLDLITAGLSEGGD